MRVLVLTICKYRSCLCALYDTWSLISTRTSYTCTIHLLLTYLPLSPSMRVYSRLYMFNYAYTDIISVFSYLFVYIYLLYIYLLSISYLLCISMLMTLGMDLTHCVMVNYLLRLYYLSMAIEYCMYTILYYGLYWLHSYLCGFSPNYVLYIVLVLHAMGIAIGCVRMHLP